MERDGHFYYRDGKATRRTTRTFFRGENANFHPSDDTLERDEAVAEYFVKGSVPSEPLIAKEDRIVAFGSCFAGNISKYLDQRGFNVVTRKDTVAYISRFGDGMVSSHAIRQQFEWAWNGRVPSVELWHGYKAEAFGYSEEVRVKTAALFDEAAVFIVTLGLSEVWYDEPTGEVFWRAVPEDKYDPARHRFRVVSQSENLDNIRAVHRLIRDRRPDAVIVFTLSPIPLTATFRPQACVVSNAASKASLRSALDAFFLETTDNRLFYFPSYEVVLDAFDHPFVEDRKHVHKHVLDFNMLLFESYFCGSVPRPQIAAAYRAARVLDRRVANHGHWSVPRNSLRAEGLKRKPAPLRFAVSNLLARLGI